MKNVYLKKNLFLLTAVLLLLFCFPVRSQAASFTPGRVASVRASGGESQAVLKWKKVKNAGGYFIYMQNGAAFKLKATVRGGNTTSCTLKKLVNNKTYTFCVAAFCKKGSKTYAGIMSAPVKVTPRVKSPSAPRLKLYENNSGSVTLSWGRVRNASGYEVLVKQEDKYISCGAKKYSSRTSVCRYTVGGLTNGQTYSFAIRSFRSVGGIKAYSNLSNLVTGKPQPAPAVSATKAGSDKGVHGAYYNAYARKNIPGTPIRKGKKVVVVDGSRETRYVSLRYKNVIYANIPRSLVRITGFKLNGHLKYSAQQAENYVNSKGYSSKTNYLLWVSIYTQRLYVFKGSQYRWKLVKTSSCATGLYNHWTRPCVSEIRSKAYIGNWSGSYSKWCTWFQGYRARAIHSWLYAYGTNSKIMPEWYGSPASQGCVRVPNGMAKWVYNTLPYHTTSVTY